MSTFANPTDRITKVPVVGTHLRLSSLLRVIWRSFILQGKDRATNNFFLGTLLIQPVIFTLLSASVYMHGGKPDLGLYAAIGAGMIGIWNNNLWTSGRVINDERRGGTLSLVVASPTSLPVIMIGKSLSNALVSLLAIGVSLGTGWIVFRMPIGIENPLAFLIGLILTLISMTTLGLVLGSIFVITRNAQEFVVVINYPIFILSGLTFPLTLLPWWTNPFSALLAPRWGNQLLNQSAGFLEGVMWPNYLWLIGLSCLYLLIARILFRGIEFMVRRAGSMEEW
jgi:ABC-2 type transport system permease protein